MGTLSDQLPAQSADAFADFLLPVLSCQRYIAYRTGYSDHNSFSSCSFRMINGSFKGVCGRTLSDLLPAQSAGAFADFSIADFELPDAYCLVLCNLFCS